MTAKNVDMRYYIKFRLKGLGWRFTPPPSPEKWIFIVGCYNSGTTLLAQLLAQHPLIGSMPNEGQFFSDELPAARDYGLPRLWALRPDLFHLKETSGSYDVDKIKRQWGWMFNDASKPLLMEKTILHAARTRWLQQHFPNSHFIALYRNGYAVAEGIHRKEKHAMEKCIRQWNDSNKILMDDLQYIMHKKEVLYEDLVADPAVVLKGITDFLKIEALPADVAEKEFRIHKVESTISNLNKKSFDNLSSDDKQVIKEGGGEMLRRLGYEILS